MSDAAQPLLRCDGIDVAIANGVVAELGLHGCPDAVHVWIVSLPANRNGYKYTRLPCALMHGCMYVYVCIYTYVQDGAYVRAEYDEYMYYSIHDNMCDTMHTIRCICVYVYLGACMLHVSVCILRPSGAICAHIYKRNKCMYTERSVHIHMHMYVDVCLYIQMLVCVCVHIDMRNSTHPT